MLKLCVIGDPVSHSLSPQLHRDLLKKAGISGTYEAVTVMQDTLPRFMSEAKAGAWDGFNVTMPLKTAILPFLDELDETAAAMQAVNTVVIGKGKAKGYNTDGPGFLTTLNGEISGKRVLILGNGGAAHAVRFALERAEAQVCVCCRHPQKKEENWNELCKLSGACDLLVNATPLGMAGREEFSDWTFLEQVPAGAVVYDLVYHPRETQLLRRAATAGHPTIGGLALLRAQAELSFQLFIS